MSFLTPNMPVPAVLFPYLNVSGAKGANTLDNGTHYFVMGFGKVSEGEDSWHNADLLAPTAAVLKNVCTFWMHEKGGAEEKNKFVKWLYTGADDPIHTLGLDTKQQSMERLREIYGDKAPKYPFRQPQTEYVVPVLKVEKTGKTYNTEKGEVVLLIVSQSILDDIIKAAAAFADVEDSSIYGRVLCIVKNLSEQVPANKYQVSITAGNPQDTSAFDAKFVEARNKGIADIERIFNEGNMGSYSADNVWRYLTNSFGGSKQALIDKYYVGSGANLANADFEEVDLT